MKLVRVFSPSFVAGALAAAGMLFTGVSAPVMAQEDEPIADITLDQLLNEIRSQRRDVSAENQERERTFRTERARQQSLLQQAQREVSTEEATSAQLESTFAENEAEIQRLDAQLAERQGTFGELFGTARAAAAETNAIVSTSMISAQFPDRTGSLTAIAQSRTLPTIEQLEDLWFVMLQEMTEQGKTVRFQGTVLDLKGMKTVEEVVRIGPFVAVANGDYLAYINADDVQGLQYLERQPGSEARAAAGRLQRADASGFVNTQIDPSMGQLLGLLVQTPTIMETIEAGGVIGNIVIGIAVVGIVLGVFKWFTLAMLNMAVSGQARSRRANKGNPLGRIMLAYQSNETADVETVSLKLDDAILKESPKLDSWLNTVKVFAAVAPLMGLLGTVTGMIKTFQQITLFGTGDPKIMAGGISEALVTTELGLIAAIPLLLLHSFAASTSRRIQQILEEQAAGLIATHAEKH